MMLLNTLDSKYEYCILTHGFSYLISCLSLNFSISVTLILATPFTILRGCICASILQISEIKFADIPDVDLSRLGEIKYGNFSVEVVHPVSDYLELMEVTDTLAHTTKMKRKKKA